METKKPTKFILALRKYRAYKQQWAEKMQEKLAIEEEELRRKREYYHTKQQSPTAIYPSAIRRTDSLI